MRNLTLGALAVLALANTACESKVTGNEGNFVFSYPTDDDVFDFNKPIAVGARLDVSVEEVGTNTPVTLTGAVSDDPNVLEVTDFSGNTFTVEAIGDGNTLIEVKAGTLGDSVNLLARVPEVHNLYHWCAATNPAYLENTVGWLGFEFEMDNGQHVIGYGYYPVSFLPAATALDASHQGQGLMKVDLASAGTTTMTSELTGSTLDIQTVTPASVDGAAEPIAFVFEDIDVGDVNPFYVWPTSGEFEVCQADELTYTVQSDTPTICDVRRIAAAAADSSPEGKEGGWFEIEGLAEGACMYTVTYPDGNAGAGASSSFTFPIEP